MIEAILVRKTPFQDRHLIGDLILRNGKKQGVLFFGGLGGGKKIKPNNLEIGKLYQIAYKSPVKGDLIQTKEWNVKWSHEQIRYDYWRFVLLSLICEITALTAIPQEDLENDVDQQHAGLFKVLSNGIFFLENNKIPNNNYHFACFFLGKFMADFGIIPLTERCIDCEQSFKTFAPSFFDIEKGGFICSQCPINDNATLNSEHLRQTILQSKIINWKNFEIGMEKIEPKIDHVKLLINYILFQLNLSQDSIKTIKSI